MQNDCQTQWTKAQYINVGEECESMQTQDQVSQSNITPEKLNQAIDRSQNYLLSLQTAEGYWWAELESNVTMASETVLLHKIWGTEATRPLHKVENYLRRQQRDHGGWELFYGDRGELSVTVEAYMAMRLLGRRTQRNC